MKDIIAATLISILLMTMLIRILAERDYKIKERQVDDIVYTYTQIASKKGEMSQSMYDEMNKKLSMLGNFYVNLKVEKFVDNSNNPITLEGKKSIIDMDLRDQGFDILTVTVEDKNRHMINTFYNSSQVKYKLNARASAPVF